MKRFIQVNKKLYISHSTSRQRLKERDKLRVKSSNTRVMMQTMSYNTNEYQEDATSVNIRKNKVRD